MNAVRSQIEQTSVDELRKRFHNAVSYAVRTGKIPPVFAGDPTFQDAVNKRRKTTEDSDRAVRAG